MKELIESEIFYLIELLETVKNDSPFYYKVMGGLKTLIWLRKKLIDNDLQISTSPI